MYTTPKCKHAGLGWAALVVVVALVAIAVSTLALKPRYQTAVRIRLERLRLNTSDAFRNLPTKKHVPFRAELPAVGAAAAGFTASDAGNITLTPSRQAGEDAGTYVTSVSYASKDPKTKLSNYAITVVPGEFTIKPALVVVSGATASKAYGVVKDLQLDGTLGPLPEDLYKPLGFSSPPGVVLPQDRARVIVKGSARTDTNNYEGKYDTIPLFTGDATLNKNYKITQIKGAFTITPRCGPPEWKYSIDTMGKCWKCPDKYDRTAEALTLADKTTSNPKACVSGSDFKAPYIFSYPA